MKRYNAPEKAAAQDDQLSEIRRLKQELARVTEERDILKKATVDSTRQRNINFQWLLSQVLSDEEKIHTIRKRNMLVFMEGRTGVQRHWSRVEC